MKFSEELKASGQMVVRDILKHPFIQDIKQGHINAPALVTYVEQDTLFLDAFAKIYAEAVIKSESRTDMRFFSDQIQYSLNEESGAHEILCELANESLDNHQNAKVRPATYLYNEHLFNAVRTGDLIDIAAASLPCPWTYNEISAEY